MSRRSIGRKSGVQGVYLGALGTFADFNESSLDYPGQLGVIVEDGEKLYQLIQLVSGATTVAADATLYWNDATQEDEVHHADQGHGTAGSAAGAITNGNYGFMYFNRFDEGRIADPT